jgi:transcriptional regulator with XRE-family HTH domain
VPEKSRQIPSTQRHLLANIRNQMARHRIAVPELAEHCGLTASGMYQILEGAAAPKIPYLEKMAERFGLTVADLFGEPVAQRMPTIHEALSVIQKHVEASAKGPDLSRVPDDILHWLSNASLDDFAMIRAVLHGDAIGREEVATVQNRPAKRRKG